MLKIKIPFLQPGRLLMITGLLILGMSSCIKSDYFPCVRPQGDVTRRILPLPPNARGIDLRLHGEVIVTKGETPSLTIIAAENIIEQISTQVAGGEIIIKQDCCIKAPRSDIQLMITLPQLSNLAVSGSGMILVEDSFESETLHLAISGSGSIRGSLSGRDLMVGISGSGKTEIDGEFLRQKVAVSGSGEARHRNIRCQQAEVFISGSGNAFVYAAQSMRVVISGSGNTYYTGSPQLTYTISGSGSVIEANEHPMNN